VHLLNNKQDPLPEQTVVSVEFFKKQDVNSHLFPEYPESHVQLLDEMQVPLPEHTVELVEFFPKH
jgi:hypothetical protein